MNKFQHLVSNANFYEKASAGGLGKLVSMLIGIIFINRSDCLKLLISLIVRKLGLD